MTQLHGVLAIYPEEKREVMQALRNSIFPGASWESIDMVLSWCRVNNVDPFLKPVHIVPMSVKKPGSDSHEWRDVLMPGIADYRIKASRSGSYIGKSGPIFGPVVEYKLDHVTIHVPEFCTIVVRRLVSGQIAEFSATEYWIENYAVARRGAAAPNSMWLRRGRGQLAKCAEAQALRMAFPELNGGAITAEEMEGKSFEHSQAHELPPILRGMNKLDTLANASSLNEAAATMQTDDVAEATPRRKISDALDDLEQEINAARTRAEIDAIIDGDIAQKITTFAKGDAADRWNFIVSEAFKRADMMDADFPGDAS